MNLNRCGYILLLGLCDGDHLIAQAVRDVLAGERSEREAAADARIARTTLRRLVARSRATMARMMTEGGVRAAELTEHDHVAA